MFAQHASPWPPQCSHRDSAPASGFVQTELASRQLPSQHTWPIWPQPPSPPPRLDPEPLPGPVPQFGPGQQPADVMIAGVSKRQAPTTPSIARVRVTNLRILFVLAARD